MTPTPRSMLDHKRWAAELTETLPVVATTIAPDTLAVLDAVLAKRFGREVADDVLRTVDRAIASGSGKR
ncbi:hypothetical protein [Saccharothrix hoggarensis]|uniref:Uncharacterized protein n=1 Tax=Saccharothrix hoggarensis TaxID=913853 RepID=A0ABW3QP28_9PSEU